MAKRNSHPSQLVDRDCHLAPDVSCRHSTPIFGQQLSHPGHLGPGAVAEQDAVVADQDESSVRAKRERQAADNAFTYPV